MASPYLADTNIYVNAANDPAFAGEFAAFRADTDLLPVSTIVLAELALGYQQRDAQERMLQSLTAASPPLTPTGDDWLRAAFALAQLGGELVTKSRSFWNDAILAAQCERLGVTLITRNTSDFRRLARILRTDVVSPFPKPL
jgi:predicted nucleic acid-binding protein